jgi:hypothetical protein
MHRHCCTTLRWFTLSFLFLNPWISLSAQTLPEEMHLSADGKILYTGGQPSKGLYEKAIIRTISLDFDQPDFWNLLTENYSSRTNIPATMTVDGKMYDSVGVRFKGLTSYRRTNDSQKKSFNISLDYRHENQDLMGYKTLNLNNAFDDPSFLREVVYLELIRNHIPAAKANFVNLEINGESWGLYPNIQQLNSDFIEEWFLSNKGTRWRADAPRGAKRSKGGKWGDGTAALNYLGPDSAPYKLYYTLKKSNKSDPWEDLITTCEVLENTSLKDLERMLAGYLDIDRTLWFLASEILFTDDDSYVFKGKMDYYLYWEAETGRLTPIEYDGNNAMDTRKASWSPFYNSSNANYPLLNRLLSVPSLRQRYLAHVRTLMKEVLQPQQASQLIDEYVSMIDSFVKADRKKARSYNKFLSNIQILKRFFTDRYTYLSNHVELNQVGPKISNVSFTPVNGSKNSPRGGEAVSVQAIITADSGVAGVTLRFGTGLVGNFSTTPMFDDGLHNDYDAADGIYGAEIPGFSHGSPVRFYIEAKAADRAATVSYLPEGAEHNVFFYQVRGDKVKRN